MVPEVAQVEQGQPAFHPGTVFERGTLVGAFAGEIQPFERPLGDVVDEVELRAGLVLVGSWIRLSQQVMRPEDRGVGHDQVAEAVELVSHCMRGFKLLERLVDELSEEVGQFSRQLVMEA